MKKACGYEIQFNIGINVDPAGQDAGCACDYGGRSESCRRGTLFYKTHVLSKVQTPLRMAMMTHWFKHLQFFHRVFLGIGVIAACVFGYHYLIAAQKDCGVVRFYEYAVGLFGLGVWGGGNLAALFLLVKPEGKHLPYLVGTTVLVVMNSLMIGLTFFLLYTVMDQAFVFTRTKTLIERVEHADDRLAVLELGRRDETGTIPLLCTIALDSEKDMNLRLNASYALREIGSRLSQDTDSYAAMFTCLLQMLTDEQQYLRSSAAETFRILNDTSAVPALLQALENESNEYVSSDIIRTLGILGDNRAIQPLSALLVEKDTSHVLLAAIEEALERIQETENDHNAN